MDSSKKRKHDSHGAEDSAKRLKVNPAADPSQDPAISPASTDIQATTTLASDTVNEGVRNKGKGKAPGLSSIARVPIPMDTQADGAADSPPVPGPSKPRINKLVPPRPFPSVPTSVSATGPRSAHKEGKNLICITRKTALGAYMRRCKDVILKDGYKTLHLSAMGAAIPHLLHLALALPPILPFAADEIHTEVTTGTVEVQDEVIPEDEDEDITYQTRGKSTVLVVIKIGDGEFEGDRSGPGRKNGRKRVGNNGLRMGGPSHGGHQVGTARNEKGKGKATSTRLVQETILQEPEQEEMDML